MDYRYRIIGADASGRPVARFRDAATWEAATPEVRAWLSAAGFTDAAGRAGRGASDREAHRAVMERLRAGLYEYALPAPDAGVFRIEDFLRVVRDAGRGGGGPAKGMIAAGVALLLAGAGVAVFALTSPQMRAEAFAGAVEAVRGTQATPEARREGPSGSAWNGARTTASTQTDGRRTLSQAEVDRLLSADPSDLTPAERRERQAVIFLKSKEAEVQREVQRAVDQAFR